MPTRDAILANIREHPDDDVVRLVYADWLEEHGDSERAEFIRLHLAVAHSDEGDERRARQLARLHRLHAAHGAGWAGFDRRNAGWAGWKWGRGFVESVTVRSLAVLPRLLDAHPVREVVLEVEGMAEGCGRRLADSGVLDRAQALVVQGGWSRNDLPVAFERGPAPSLRALRVDGWFARGDDWAPIVAACPNLRHLATGQSTGPPTAPLLGALPRLEELDVDGCPDPEEGIASFLDPLPDRLLGLGFRGFHCPDVRALFSGAVRLRRLDLAGCSGWERWGQPSTARAFLSLPPWGTLVSLGLERTALGGPSARWLVDSGHLAGVRGLDLSDNVLTPGNLATILAAPGLEGLRILNVRGNHYLDGTAAGVLARADHLTELVSLELGRCDLKELRDLFDGPAAARLRVLSFSSNERPAALLDALRVFPQPSHLHTLRIYTAGTPIDWDVRSALECDRLPHLTHLSFEGPDGGLFVFPPSWVDGTGAVWPVDAPGPAPRAFFHER